MLSFKFDTTRDSFLIRLVHLHYINSVFGFCSFTEIIFLKTRRDFFGVMKRKGNFSSNDI